MKIPHICIIMNMISDLSENSVLKLPNGIAELRKYVKMLIIDDNDFTPEPYLKANEYQIYHKTDIDTIRDVEPYDIILCDISGVGKKLGYDKEGAFIIREIHANYPSKRIIAYTSYTFDPEYNQFLSMADFVAPKDFGIDDWINVLDEQVRKSINPVSQWAKIRDYLLENGVSTLTIAKIEDKYVAAVNNRNFDKLKTFVEGKDSKLRTCIHSRRCRLGEGFFRQTRQIFAGILCVLQENLTQDGGKRPVKTVFEVVNTGSYFNSNGLPIISMR